MKPKIYFENFINGVGKEFCKRYGCTTSKDVAKISKEVNEYLEDDFEASSEEVFSSYFDNDYDVFEIVTNW